MYFQQVNFLISYIGKTRVLGVRALLFYLFIKRILPIIMQYHKRQIIGLSDMFILMISEIVTILDMPCVRNFGIKVSQVRPALLL